MTNRYQKGFTLIEVLVAASILGIIGLTILTTFGSGFSVYERVQSYGGVQSNALLALEEIEKDLRNTFPSEAIEFKGDSKSIAFPTLIETLESVDGEDSIVSPIGKISYYFDYDTQYLDGKTRALMQARQDYSQAVTGVEVETGQSAALVTLDDITFSYYSYDEEEESFSWGNSWTAEEGKFLEGVKIEMNYTNGGQNVQLARTVLIPAAQGVSEEEEEEEEGEDDEEGEEEGGEES